MLLQMLRQQQARILLFYYVFSEQLKDDVV